MNIAFTPDAWAEYLYWNNRDLDIFKKINALVTDIKRNGAMNGIGKPEMLKYRNEAEYSRKITKEHRLVYVMQGIMLIIISCKGHYDG